MSIDPFPRECKPLIFVLTFINSFICFFSMRLCNSRCSLALRLGKQRSGQSKVTARKLHAACQRLRQGSRVMKYLSIFAGYLSQYCRVSRVFEQTVASLICFSRYGKRTRFYYAKLEEIESRTMQKRAITTAERFTCSRRYTERAKVQPSIPHSTKRFACLATQTHLPYSLVTLARVLAFCISEASIRGGRRSRRRPNPSR